MRHKKLFLVTVALFTFGILLSLINILSIYDTVGDSLDSEQAKQSAQSTVERAITLSNFIWAVMVLAGCLFLTWVVMVLRDAKKSKTNNT